MRFLRLVALVGSLVLLVATAVSVVHRRGDLRDDRAVRLEQASLLVSQSIGNSITRLRQDVHLAAAAAPDSTTDRRALADDLVRFFPGSEACVGDVSGCTDSDLFALREINDLAALSVHDDARAEDVGALAQIGVDSSSESLLVVRQTASGEGAGLVAMRVPIHRLVSAMAATALAGSDLDVDVVPRSQDAADEVGEPENDGDRRTMTETIGTPFANGSLAATVEVTGSVGIADEVTLRFVVLLALGAVLLALAGWTLVAEGRQLERRATTDELTDLINRREFERVSEAAIDLAARSNTSICVMVLDLNGFKLVNDTLGHQFGDLVLVATAERLVDAVRDTDIVGRWGGDEFTILLPGLSERTAVRNSAERIWHRLSDTPVVGDTTISASIGAAIFPRHGTTLDALMRAADVAMYEAKSTGVSHRIADTIAVSESFLAEFHERVAPNPGGVGADEVDADGQLVTEPPEPIVTDDYVGMDRRRSPVPPPPQQPTDLFPPAGPDPNPPVSES